MSCIIDIHVLVTLEYALKEHYVDFQRVQDSTCIDQVGFYQKWADTGAFVNPTALDNEYGPLTK